MLQPLSAARGSLANLAGDAGGGVYTDDTFEGAWSATNSQIVSNIAGHAGGGIFSSSGLGTDTLTNSRVRANKPDNCAPPGSVAACPG